MTKKTANNLLSLGNRPALGPLESKIMEIAWKRGEVTVRDVYDELRQERDLAYTTVMTVVHNLRGKGLLEQRVEGKIHLFKTTQSRNQFVSSRVGELLDTLLEGFTEPVMAHLIEHFSNNDPRQLEELERLIAESRSKAKKSKHG
jgi:predicted transcriptional regulator